MALELTPRLGLNTFDQGDDEWDHTDTVEWLDEHGVDHGTYANRPAEGEHHGEPYHALDINTTFYWDANNQQWGYMAGFGSENNRINQTLFIADVDIGSGLTVGGGAEILDGDLDVTGKVIADPGFAGGPGFAFQDYEDTGIYHASSLPGFRLSAGGTIGAEVPEGGGFTVRNGDLDVQDGGGAYEQGSRLATREYVDSSSSDFTGVADNLSVTEWQQIDVGNEGFPGDRTGGDLAQFIADTITADGKYVFVLPDGTYDWQRQLNFGSSDSTHGAVVPEMLAIIGKPDATLHVDIGATEDFRRRLCFEMTTALDKFSLQHLHFDIGDHNGDRDAGIMRGQVNEHGYFDDISITGRRRWEQDAPDASDTYKNGDRHTFKLDVMTQHGTARVRNIYFPDGDIYEPNAETAGHAIPCSSEHDHVGYTKWEHCYVQGFIDNGYYLRDGPGSNHITDSQAVDCGAGGFRLGINDRAENVTARLENADFNATGLWLEEHRDTDPYDVGSEEETPIVVDGFEVYALGGAVNVPIRISNDPGKVVLRNGYLEMEDGVDDYIISASADSGHLHVEDFTVDDRSSGATREGAFNIHMPSTFTNLVYRPDPQGTNNGRSIFRTGGKLEVRDSEVNGTYKPMVEAYAGSDIRWFNVEFPHDGSTSSPYIFRYQDTQSDVERLTARDCDFRDYASWASGDGIGSIVFTHLDGNRGDDTL